MQEQYKQIAVLFGAVFPIVFSLLFFGIYSVKFDIVLYTDNIEGEGICTTSLCPPKSFSPFYETGCYFGSKLKKATIKGYHYDVRDILLTISDVTEADIIGFDIKIFGITVRHYDIAELTVAGDYGGIKMTSSSIKGAMHFKFEDPDKGTSIDLAPPIIPIWFWLFYWCVILAASFLVTLLAYCISTRIESFTWILWSISGIVVSIIMGEYFCDSLAYTEIIYFLFNWLLIYLISVVIGAISIPCVGTVTTMLIVVSCYIANFFVIALRGKPIMPADLKAAGTAAEVMGGYVFIPTWQMIVGIVITLVYAACVILVWRSSFKTEGVSKTNDTNNSPKTQLVKRITAIVVSVLIAIICVNTPVFDSANSFAWDGMLQKSFHQEGMVLTFLKNALNSTVKKPEGYSQEKVQEYLEGYLEKQNSEKGIQPTNIIMVMNEAFSDLRTVGLNEKVDVMPFIDSLDNNTTTGNLHVSVFGGGTCNTEFEALTGNSLAFLSNGAYPYTENITKPMFSLASYFRDKGFLTEAFHANEAQNWNRNMVYPFIGFSRFNSIKDYENELNVIPYLHGHPADTADYAFIEKVDIENNKKPRFLFNVTMQNHSGYERWENLEEAEILKENVPDMYMDARVYLSLVKASDDAIKQLVEQYQNSNEPTMIVFFGDHQPGLPGPAQSEIYTKTDSYLDMYKSKFFIWTNYKSKAEKDVDLSANFLPYLIMKKGNYKMPPFVQMLEEVHEKYPVISAMGIIDSDGNRYNRLDDITDDPLIQKYRYIQYANMFDEIDDKWFAVE